MRVVTGLRLLLALAMLAGAWQLGRALSLGPSFRSSAIIQAYDVCLSRLRPLLPRHGVIRYDGHDPRENVNDLYLAQYALAPLLVVTDPAEPRVVSDCSPPDAATDDGADAADGMGRVLLSLLLPLAVGYLLACRAWRPCGGPAAALLVFRLSLAVALAIGLSSGLSFVWAVCAGPARPGLGVVEVLGFGLLAAVLLRTTPAAATPAVWTGTGAEPRGPRRLFWFVLACAAGTAAIYFWRSPHGDWDAWAIWNLRARFLDRAGDHWAETFSKRNGWCHPDYPLLLPGAVARSWYYAGSETTLAPRLLALLFTAATVGLLTSSLALLRGPTQGWLGGLVLLATGGFLDLGTAQYADVPLACYFLASAALFEVYDRGGSGRLPALAGLLGGMAAWTKNEGALFLVVTVLARAGVKRSVRRREWAAFAVGVLPFLLLLVYFKLRLAPANDLVEGQGWARSAGRLLGPTRWALVAGYFFQALARIGPGAVGVLALYGWLVGRTPAPHAAGHTAAVLALMLGGYGAVYLLTPHDLAWHLATSVDRLFLQLWPLALLAFFLKVATPREALT